MIISASSKKSTSNQFKNKKMYLCISKLMGDGLWGLLICWPQVFIKDTGYFQTALPGTLQISVQIPMHLEQLPAASTAVCAFEQTWWEGKVGFPITLSEGGGTSPSWPCSTITKTHFSSACHLVTSPQSQTRLIAECEILLAPCGWGS